MSSDDRDFLNDLSLKLRKRQMFCPLTPEEAEKAYNQAPEVPISPERIKEIVKYVTSRDRKLS